MPTTTGMKSGGYYDAHSHEQRAALDAFLPWLETAIIDLPVSCREHESYTLFDIGSSEGGNAIYVMNRLIAALRRVSDRPVQVLFNDLPTNDFNHLFDNLFPSGAPALAGANIFPGAIGGTAFGRLVVPRSTHVATTFNAIGFLDTKPKAALPHYILPVGPGPLAPREGVSVTAQERTPFQQQAESDLRRFYAARAEELVSGGTLLVQVFGRNETVSTSHGIYDVLSDALLDRIEAGALAREVYAGLIFPIYFRTLEELTAPLEQDPEFGEAFRIVQAQSREVSVPFNDALAENGDVGAWASSYMGFLRAFTEAILAAALPADATRIDTLDGIYRRVEERLVADPARYEFHYISIAALLTRV